MNNNMKFKLNEGEEEIYKIFYIDLSLDYI